MATLTEREETPGRAHVRPASGWYVAWGLLLIASGVLAMIMPGLAAFSTALLFAWLLVIGGVSELAYAFHSRSQAGFGWKLASGILTLALGVAVLLVPLAGVVSLAVLVGAFLFAGGIARIGLALKMKPVHGWGWILFDGLLSVGIAVLIGIGWPQNSIAFIGLLTGMWLVWAGVWRILLRPWTSA